jgi:putative ABC transport system ATP-binding protein
MIDGKKMFIEATGLKRIYNKGIVEVPALRGVTLGIDKGEFLAIMGPSGSGKSTLMHLLGGLDRPTEGRYLFDDMEINCLNDLELSRFRNRRVGFVFQSFHLIPQLTVSENVEMPLIYTSIRRDRRRETVSKMLESVGLAHRADHYPNELSGGECQRVAIGRALIGEPDIILADEPTGNLDTQTGSEIMNLISSLQRSGRTVILVTHDIQIANWAERIIQMKDGLVLKEFLDKITADMLQF